MDTITVTGPHGSFEVCAATGQIVTPYTRMPPVYRHYSGANVAQLKSWCVRQGLLVPREVPLLCLTMRRYGGTVEPVEETFREEWGDHYAYSATTLAA